MNTQIQYTFIIILIILLFILFYSYYCHTISPKFSLSFSQIISQIDYNNNTNNLSSNVIFIYSHDFKELPEYSKYSINMYKYYCNLHNYKLIIKNHYPNTSISPYWLRVKDLIELSNIYPENSIFVYIDLDTILNPKYLNIKIDQLLNSIDIYDNINYNLYLSKEPQIHLNINTGIICIKNTKYSQFILNKWYKYYPKDKWILSNNKWKCYKNNYINCLFAGYEYEQGSLDYIYKNNLYQSRNNIKILDHNICSNRNYKDDTFIYHFMGVNNLNRIKYMKDIFYRKDYINRYDNKNLYYLLKDPEIIPKNKNDEVIPNILFQTYYDKNKIPDYIFDNIKKYANNYEYILYDDKDAINFLDTYFNKQVVNKFKNLRLGAHKADLLRYCFLYIYGGIYLDIKTILIKPLDDIFINKKYFYTVISSVRWFYQGILASPPRNILFLSLIDKIVNSWYISTRLNYLIFCQDLYNKIKKDNINNKVSPGLNKGKTQDYYLFEEKCSTKVTNECNKLDRYGYCCSIYDNNNKIFIGRDPTFPWK